MKADGSEKLVRFDPSSLIPRSSHPYLEFPMPSAISRTVKNRGSRSKNGVNRPQPTVPIAISSVTKAGSVLTIVFAQPVILKGVPKYTTNLAGVTAISAAMTTPTTLAVTFSAAVTTATTLNIPYEEPAVRNSSGGFVSDSTFPVT